MKHGLKEVRLYLGIFDYTIIMVFGAFSRLEKYLQWKYEDPNIKIVHPNGIPLGRTSHKGGYVPVIWLPRIPKTNREIATLAHEASHAIDDLIYWLDIEESNATGEIRGHGIRFIVENVLKLNRRIK